MESRNIDHRIKRVVLYDDGQVETFAVMLETIPEYCGTPKTAGPKILEVCPDDTQFEWGRRKAGEYRTIDIAQFDAAVKIAVLLPEDAMIGEPVTVAVIIAAPPGLLFLNNPEVKYRMDEMATRGLIQILRDQANELEEELEHAGKSRIH